MTYYCNCGYQLSKDNYKYHLKKLHWQLKTPAYCTLCIAYKEFPQIESFENHILVHHPFIGQTLIGTTNDNNDQLQVPNFPNVNPIEFDQNDFLNHSSDSFNISLNQREDDSQDDLEEEIIDLDLDQLFAENERSNQDPLFNTLTGLQLDLLDAIINVKSNNAGTVKVIRESMLAAFAVINKHFKTQYFADYSKEYCSKIVTNDYYLKKRRTGNIRKTVSNHDSGNVYYYSIRDILNIYVKTPVVYHQLLKENSTRRDDTVIRSILDLDKVK